MYMLKRGSIEPNRKLSNESPLSTQHDVLVLVW